MKFITLNETWITRSQKELAKPQLQIPICILQSLEPLESSASLVTESDRKYIGHRVEQMHCVTKTRGGKELYTGSWEGNYSFCRLHIFKGHARERDCLGRTGTGQKMCKHRAEKKSSKGGIILIFFITYITSKGGIILIFFITLHYLSRQFTFLSRQFTFLSRQFTFLSRQFTFLGTRRGNLSSRDSQPASQHLPYLFPCSSTPSWGEV
jgi:hypothetical protein